jgi:glycosyltransferase involved in cell wall biosynthesis
MSAQPPRLLIVTTVYNMIRDFLLPYAEHYRAKGWRVDALAQPDSTFDECRSAFDHAWTIEWSRNPMQLRNPVGHLRRMRGLVARERYDIVHVHTPIAGFLGRAALRGARSRDGTIVIYTAHGFHFHSSRGRFANAPFSLAEKAAARWTDYLVVINEEDARAARRLSLLPPDRIVQMPGIGIDTSRFQPERVSADEVAAVRRELGLEPHVQLVLVVAEFTFNKRHADAVRAFAQIGDTRAHLALAGREGPALEGTRQLVAELGLASRVHWLGFRDDVPALIRASTATLLLSAREGLPLSVLESLSLATPVVGTRIRGISDLLNGGGGSLVEVGDVAAAARAIRVLLDDPQGARAAGEQGRRTVARYDIGNVIEMHDRLYDRALAQRGRPPQNG